MKNIIDIKKSAEQQRLVLDQYDKVLPDKSCVLSWRYDLDENGESKSIQYIVNKVNEFGFDFLLVDFITVDQNPETIIRDIHIYSNYYNKLPVIYYYPNLSLDVGRLWICNEIMRSLPVSQDLNSLHVIPPKHLSVKDDARAIEILKLCIGLSAVVLSTSDLVKSGLIELSKIAETINCSCHDDGEESECVSDVHITEKLKAVEARLMHKEDGAGTLLNKYLKQPNVAIDIAVAYQMINSISEKGEMSVLYPYDSLIVLESLFTNSDSCKGDIDRLFLSKDKSLHAHRTMFALLVNAVSYHIIEELKDYKNIDLWPMFLEKLPNFISQKWRIISFFTGNRYVTQTIGCIKLEVLFEKIEKNTKGRIICKPICIDLDKISFK